MLEFGIFEQSWMKFGDTQRYQVIGLVQVWLVSTQYLDYVRRVDDLDFHLHVVLRTFYPGKETTI